MPATSAEKVLGAPEAAFETKDGVRVSVDASDWHGDPEDLGDRFTPVKVRIVNNSGKPLRILYEDFAFKAANGRVFLPLPAFPVDVDDGRVGTIKPIYAATKFFVADRYKTVYPSLMPWPDQLERNEDLYRNQFQKWKGQRPTTEMRRMGLPEGVLADGGAMAGYLYFESLTKSLHKPIFEASLTDSTGDETITTIAIPFRVE